MILNSKYIPLINTQLMDNLYNAIKNQDLENFKILIQYISKDSEESLIMIKNLMTYAMKNGELDIYDFITREILPIHKYNDEEIQSTSHHQDYIEIEQLFQKCTLNSIHNNHIYPEFYLLLEFHKMLKKFLNSEIDINYQHLEAGFTLLHMASYYGYKDIIKFLLSKKPNLECQSKLGKTPLRIAVERNNIKIVQILINAGANINSNLVNKKSIADIAIENKNDKIIELFLNNGGQLNEIFNKPALFVAISQEMDIIVELLLNYNISLDKKEFWDIDNLENNNSTKILYSWTPLFLAIKIGNIKILNMILKKEVTINYKLNNYYPIHFAIQMNNIEIIEILLDNGCDINEKCCYSSNPILHAIEKNNLLLLQFLINKGASLKIADESLLNLAITKKCNESIIKCLVKNNVDIFTKWKNSLLPLHYMLLLSSDISNELLQLFFDHGINPNWKSGSHNETILHFIIKRKKYYHTIDYLLNSRINVNISDNTGNTAYYYIINKIYNIVEIALRQGELLRYRQSDNSKINLSNINREFDCGKGAYECLEHKIIVAKLFTKEIAILSATRRNMHRQMVVLYKNWFVKPYYNICRREILKAKDFQICDKITFLDVLSASSLTLVEYSRNEELMDYAKREDYLNDFPEIGTFFLNRMLYGEKKRILHDNSIESFRKLVKIELPEELFLEISQYLSTVDLNNMYKAVYEGKKNC
ncbi:putative ankyrin repeat protein RF_0381 [Leptopilina boulardi]|uniref:putative ankyrin repeat protein RF_0381 n=1 Tax=Leptopilina boulardi TaxID=63433 RepID=UPI0021F5F014|nr:putative ankyrin repeat protein RF_0381 [Leptopilina boulardi]